MSCCCGRQGFGQPQRDTTCTVWRKLRVLSTLNILLLAYLKGTSDVVLFVILDNIRPFGIWFRCHLPIGSHGDSMTGTVVWGDHIYLKMEALFCLRNTANIFHFHIAEALFAKINIIIVVRDHYIYRLCVQLLQSEDPFLSGNCSVERLHET